MWCNISGIWASTHPLDVGRQGQNLQNRCSKLFCSEQISFVMTRRSVNANHAGAGHTSYPCSSLTLTLDVCRIATFKELCLLTLFVVVFYRPQLFLSVFDKLLGRIRTGLPDLWVTTVHRKWLYLVKEQLKVLIGFFHAKWPVLTVHRAASDVKAPFPTTAATCSVLLDAPDPKILTVW